MHKDFLKLVQQDHEKEAPVHEKVDGRETKRKEK